MDRGKTGVGSIVIDERAAANLPERVASLVARAKSLAVHIERLPAVATLDWCEQSAHCLATGFPGTVAAIIIGHVSGSGDLTGVEAAGVDATGEFDVSRVNYLTSVRSEIESIGVLPLASTPKQAISLRELIGESWSSSRVGRIFRPVSCSDVFVSIHSIPGGEPGRAIVSVVGFAAGRAVAANDFFFEVPALLWASTEHIAERAAIAIGGQRSTRGRWISEREREVLDLLVLGLSVRQIAEELGRSTHTVHDHVKSLHKKLNANSRGELVSRALGHLGSGRVPVKTTLRAMPGSAIEPSKPMVDLTNDIASEIAQKQDAARPRRAKRLPLV